MNTIAPVLLVVGSRPTVTPTGQPIPPGAAIYNAPRPLYGALTWTAQRPDFQTTGPFFAAIDPDAGDDFDRQYAAEYAVENARLDARELRFVSEDEAFVAGVAYTRKRYAGTPVDAKLDGMIPDAKYRPSFVRNGLQELAEAAKQ